MFGERLRELRKEKKLTMKEFGKKFNLAESTISGYENGNRKPDLDVIRSFADFFEVSVDYLIGNTNDPTVKPLEGKPKINRGFHKLPEDITQEEEEYLKMQLEIFRKLKNDKK